MGGACLVAQYPAQPKSCTKHSECALPSSGIGEGAASYCLPESPGKPTSGNGKSVPPVGAGSCWIKPSEDFCLKGAGVGSHDTAPVNSAPVAAATGVKRWRVLTCLNGIPLACTGQVPATPERIPTSGRAGVHGELTLGQPLVGDRRFELAQRSKGERAAMTGALLNDPTTRQADLRMCGTRGPVFEISRCRVAFWLITAPGSSMDCRCKPRPG